MKKPVSSNHFCRRIFSIFIIEVTLTAIVAPCYANQMEKEQCKASQASLEQLKTVESNIAIKSAAYTEQSPVIKDLIMQRNTLIELLQNQEKLCPSSRPKIYSPLSEPVMGLW
jgi:hypothetical protein